MVIKRTLARWRIHLAPVFALALLGGLGACSTTGGNGFFSFGSEEQPAAQPQMASSTSGGASIASADNLAVQVKAMGSVQDVIAKLKDMIHKNGMMVMGDLHQGKVMSMVGLDIESESIFIGSAAVGKKLFSANPGAGIAVPVRINVYKAADGSTMVAYVPPSRILSTYHNPMMNKVAGMMDGKLKMMTGMLGGMNGRGGM